MQPAKKEGAKKGVRRRLPGGGAGIACVFQEIAAPARGVCGGFRISSPMRPAQGRGGRGAAYAACSSVFFFFISE